MTLAGRVSYIEAFERSGQHHNILKAIEEPAVRHGDFYRIGCVARDIFTISVPVLHKNLDKRPDELKLAQDDKVCKTQKP